MNNEITYAIFLPCEDGFKIAYHIINSSNISTFLLGKSA
jgi:hypothetical protein